MLPAVVRSQRGAKSSSPIQRSTGFGHPLQACGSGGLVFGSKRGDGQSAVRKWSKTKQRLWFRGSPLTSFFAVAHAPLSFLAATKMTSS